VLDIDPRIASVLAGRKRQTINAIQEETNTSIYLAPTTSTVLLPYMTSPRDSIASNGTGPLPSTILGVESTSAAHPIPSGRTGELPPAFIPSSVQQPRAPQTANHQHGTVDGLQDSIARLCLSPASGEKPQATDEYVESLGEMKSKVWVTGDPAGVMNAKEILSRLVFAKVSRGHKLLFVLRALMMYLCCRGRHCSPRRLPSSLGS
jgi:hypothetical protein